MAEILFYDVRQKSPCPSWRGNAPKGERDAVKIPLLEKREHDWKGCCTSSRSCRFLSETVTLNANVSISLK